ncbi:hypothetical protein [Cupriavidus pauculus]
MNQQDEKTTQAKQIVAVFQPQAWIDDYAVDIDCAVSVNVVHRVLALSLDKIHRLGEQDFAIDTVFPAHALDHDGPCRVDLAEPVRAFFGVTDLSEITEQMLTAARQEAKALLVPVVDPVPASNQQDQENEALPGTTDLSTFENVALIGELRRRGLIVSAWSQEDVVASLENDDETDGLTDTQFNLLEEQLFEKARVSLEDLLAGRGNQHIADTWDIHRTTLLQEVNQ